MVIAHLRHGGPDRSCFAYCCCSLDRFAALGNYQGAPWFVHLADKLLEGSEAVADLVAWRTGGFERERSVNPTYISY